jgi:FtsH-binding integral membrane protein
MNCTGANNFCSLVGSIIGVINVLVPIVVTIALIVFFWGLVLYIYHAADQHAHSSGRDMIIWGLIGIFVISCVWGIIKFFSVALFGS